jgi:hypothetical protein
MRILTVGVDCPWPDPLEPCYYCGMIGRRVVFSGTKMPWWAWVLLRLRLGIVIVEKS